ncbi:phosphotyrosine protein phosphatase [Histoplasma capsulatum H143]|uniref:Phosphotyrosine protein phosphatase n=1 Tax=Ajellomyces capsulatus (strain H143) TaxID=544712 RepID=C6HPD1_AJECH|nr:phosphotyrosine protein phosphatase [Histoplasma capsulatum H143]
MAATNPTTANPAEPKPISVLFVCLGNICRSPMAEAIFRHQITTTAAPPGLAFSTIDSAGTGAYHTNSPPDPRTMSTLRNHGITTYTHAARKIKKQDFFAFDYILAMDSENLENLAYERRRAVRGNKKNGQDDAEAEAEAEGASAKIAEVRLIGDFSSDGSVTAKPGGGEVVGDPYYGGKEGFEVIYAQLVRLCQGFLKFLAREVEKSVGA